ncbi:MAG: hypothetical protein Q8R36_03210 [bacterium]|nr:hypothetical protein [bacterium]
MLFCGDFLTDEAAQLMEEVEDISEKIGLSDEEKLFFVEVIAAFYGSEKPKWEEVSRRLPHEPRVKEACKIFFKKHKLKMSDIELQ